MSTNPTWYDLLGVAPDASAEEIKAAWRDATDKFEPGAGTSQFRLFNEAADVLLNPERRAAYDAGLAAEGAVDVEPVSAAEPVPPVDLTKTTPPPEALETPATEAASVEPVPEGDLVEQPAEPTPSSRSGGVLGVLAAIPTLALALLGVVLVAAIVLATVVGLRLNDRVQVFNAGPDASAAAERALTSVLSYDYRHMTADRDRAARFLTPSYRKQYVKNFDDLLTKGPDGSPGPAEKTQAVVTADVLNTAVVDAESHRVRVIVFVNQSSVKAGGQPTTFQDRVVATMVERNGSWLVDNIKSY
jgi:Mce-associated membrane protein